jgi:ABC-type nitrate/sulfonate/bicarbonate transport system permease component
MSRLTGLLPLALLLVVWQLVGPERSVTFPRPSTWLAGLQAMYADGTLLPAVGTTLLTFVASLIVATAVGAAVGIVMGASQRIDRAFTPILDFFRSLPPPAIVPVAGLILGLTLVTNVVIVVIGIVWPILLNTISGMHDVPRVRLDMARSLGLTPLERLTKVVLPSLAPRIMLGVRTAASISLILTLLVDMLGTGDGLGRQLLLHQQRFQANAVWGLLLVTGFFGYAANTLIVVGERYALRHWPEGRR